MNSMKESDWKKFRTLRESALERFCDRILEEAAGIAADRTPSSHEAYLRLYGLLDKRDEELGDMFNNPRLSTALLQLLAMYGAGLVTEEELSAFSEETQERVRKLQYL